MREAIRERCGPCLWWWMREEKERGSASHAQKVDWTGQKAVISVVGREEEEEDKS